MLSHQTKPFVLLDDARPDGAPARLYVDPLRIVEAHTVAEVDGVLAAIRAARHAGLHAVGFLAYEAAGAFEPAVPRPIATDQPLAWFGIFADYAEIAPDAVAALLPDPAGAWNSEPVPAIDPLAYDAQFAAVQAEIVAGGLYQANLTYRATMQVRGDPLSLYARLRRSAAAGFGALIDTGAATILSLSPELFFALEGERLTCRPMKGTARRQASHDADRSAATALAQDTKQRAENLMIVDLMRNDLARVARAGSVAVPTLFAVETYPTVHQMVSTITADLAPRNDAVDVLAALFPCGSITGAPKIAAMQAIGRIEPSPRGLYTGTIARFDATGDAMANVAIRTLTWPKGEDTATLGAGGGIVADSDPAAEWDEARAKLAFLTHRAGRFDLIETMGFDPEQGLLLLDRHLERLAASARAFDFVFDRHTARNELQAATFRLRVASRVRLLLAPSGMVAIEVSAMPVASDQPVAVAVMPLPVAVADIRLRHKTSDRRFYDQARAASGAFEVVFERPDGRLTEGSFTSLFVPRGDVLVTPPLADGLLPGVLRADLLASGRAVEGMVTAAELAHEFFIGNAVRGLIRARRTVATAPAAR
ncbi:aminodeoxychorismate synthase component I [Sphingomonas sp. CARO-RG-8B-R24-01]|uniref:aminodeoxychorismate synthase component I n=1 Tax=Sphingomonas sp. CARO-RG-8B-R24-01 TaxID=2914831 RepID=UPI001F5A42F1|nr:aminodeoxychorismate synthase component I [Sphingomonas sp. CARO-RG-8B-R24-01]